MSALVTMTVGAGSALGGDEPYQAFTAVADIELWH